MNQKVEVKKLTSKTWMDFVSLMQTDAQCSECWCLNHLEPAGCPTGLKPGEWSIHCIFVKDGLRGQGISTELIRAAVLHAKSNGAALKNGARLSFQIGNHLAIDVVNLESFLDSLSGSEWLLHPKRR